MSLTRSLGMTIIIAALLCAFANIARAQINYDAANRAYFVIGDATIDTDISGNEVFVGKDNATNFATLPDSIKFRVGSGANLSYFGDTVYPDGKRYYGLNVFGAHLAEVQSATVVNGYDFSALDIFHGVGNAYSHDSSTINIQEFGVVRNLASYDNSTVNVHSFYGNSAGYSVAKASAYDSSNVYITDGDILALNGHNNSVINITNGRPDYPFGYPRLNDVKGYDSTTINMSGGRLDRAYMRDSSTLYTSFSSVDAVYGRGASTLNISSGADFISVADTSTLNLSGYGGSVFGEGASAINISGGGVRETHGSGTSVTNIMGGRIGVVTGRDAATTIFRGHGLNATKTLTLRYDFPDDVYKDYKYLVTGLLSDGSELNTTVYSTLSDASSDQIAFLGAPASERAPDLYIIEPTALGSGGIYSKVTIGKSEDGSIDASPTVSVNGDAFLGAVKSFNSSTVNIRGGTVVRVTAHDASAMHISGGAVDSIEGYAASVTEVSGGNVVSLRNYDTSSLNVSGGAVEGIEGYDASVISITGGKVADVNGYDVCIVNITGGMVGGAFGTVNISGGEVRFFDGGTLNLTGGAVSAIYGGDASALHISGGNVGGIDGDLYDENVIGVYLYGGTLSLQGSGFALSDTFFDSSGAYSTLTGTLLDGTALNTTLYLANGLTIDGQGATQDFPLLPDSNNDGVFTFEGVPSGAWFDPPLVGSYEFAMLGGNFFTSILDFPSGIGDADGLFTVSVGEAILGQFSSGTAVNFADFGFAGGVSAFTISGIDPTVDGGNPTAFPIKLAFSSDFASFTMTGVGGPSAAPEPGTVGLLALGLILGAAGTARRSKR